MKIIVSRISKETSNGNVILSLTATKATPFGNKTAKYLTAVESGSEPELNAILEVDLEEFEIRERTWTDDEGREVTNKWLHLKDN